MKPEIKAEWVAALRSGEYLQGHNRLREADGGGFCCLGVLCEIAVRHGVIPAPELDDGQWTYGKPDEERNDAVPPESVAEWADLPWILDEDGGPDYRQVNPRVKTGTVDLFGNPRVKDLAALNDSGNYDFNAIADLIEEQL